MLLPLLVEHHSKTGDYLVLHAGSQYFNLLLPSYGQLLAWNDFDLVAIASG